MNRMLRLLRKISPPLLIRFSLMSGIAFRTEQINDLLKSLVLQDFGSGKIAPVVFGSRDPIERTLKSFAIDLTDNPSLAELLNRMRGIEVEITAPNSIKGVVVGTEAQEQKVKDEVIRI